MSPIRILGTLRPEGAHDVRPRGSLIVHEPAERLAARTLLGIYEANGPIDRLSLRWPAGAGWVAQAIPSEFPEIDVVDECDEEVIWGGALVNHYGHFLIESVGRLWSLVDGGQLCGRRVVFSRAQKLSSPAAIEWLEAFGVSTMQLPEEGAVRFTRMVVPELAWRLDAWCSPEIRDIHLHARRGLNVIPHAPPRDVVWLSRSKLPGDRSAYDECLLEWLLDGHVAVIHPEQLSLSEQVAALEGSRAAAGVIGSAFHTLLLTERTPDCLYFCPQLPKPGYPAQHQFLDGEATFAVQTLKVAGNRHEQDIVTFPAGFRLVIPEVLRALSATVLPGLLDDPRLAVFADPERHRSKANRPSTGDLDTAVMRALLEPLSVEARRKLGTAFEEQGLERCAREQFAMVADLANARDSASLPEADTNWPNLKQETFR